MQIKGIRINVVIAAIVITLAVLLTIQFLYQKYDVEQPLFKLYSQTKLVEKAPKIEQKGNRVNVILDVKKTENLRLAYQDLENYTEQVMGSTKFSIQLKDNRTNTLENAYYQSQFVIYEALAKGNFTDMAKVIQQNAAKIDAKSRVFIDNDNIYVEILKGDNYLYEIIPRKPDTTLQGSSAGMGSEQR
ncbi:MAG: hypothetical protein ACYC21_08830 [Eubacteriales bacterium]